MKAILSLLLFSACGTSTDSVPVAEVSPDEPVRTEVVPETPPLPLPANVPFAIGGVANGEYAPEIALADLRDDSAFSLRHHLGPARTHPTKVAIVSFSASWCGPCQASLPQLASLKESYGDEILVVIASIDESDSGVQREIAEVRRAGLDGPVVHATEEVQRAWLGDTRNIPHIFVINQIGEVLVQDRGYGDNVRGVLPRQVTYAHEHPEYVDR